MAKKSKAKLMEMNATAEKYPNLNAALTQIEGVTHALELSEGRYAYLKYLDSIYAFYWTSKEKGKRKRDRLRICKLRGLKARGDACLLSVLIRATSDLPKSARYKHVARLRKAAKENVAPENFRIFTKRPQKTARRQRTLLPISPKLRLVQSQRH